MAVLISNVATSATANQPRLLVVATTTPTATKPTTAQKPAALRRRLNSGEDRPCGFNDGAGELGVIGVPML